MLTRLRAVRMGHRAPGSAAPCAPSRDASDRGASLIELMVGTGLLAVIGGIATIFLVGSSTAANRVGEQSQTAADARVAAEQIGGLLRLADTPTARAGFATGRFEVLTPTRVVFYANVDPAGRTGTGPRTPPSRIDLSLDASGVLWEKVYAPRTKYTTYPSPYDYTANYGTTPTVTTALLKSVYNYVPTLPADQTPVFTYCTVATDPTTSCSAATTATSIAAIGVTLIVRGLPGARSQRITTTVAITGAVS